MASSSFREHSAGYLTNHVARLFAQALYERLLPHGVAPGQFPVLLLLWEEEELSQTDLAARLDIEQPTMANTLKRMERDRLIRRVADPNDGRRAVIHLTPKARLLTPVLTGLAREVNAIALSPFSQSERVQVIEMLTRMRAALTAASNGDHHEP